jgi:hypothetical protein
MARAKRNVDHRSTKVERIRQTASFPGAFRRYDCLGTMIGFYFFNSECVAALSASLPTPQRPAKKECEKELPWPKRVTRSVGVSLATSYCCWSQRWYLTLKLYLLANSPKLCLSPLVVHGDLSMGCQMRLCRCLFLLVGLVIQRVWADITLSFGCYSFYTCLHLDYNITDAAATVVTTFRSTRTNHAL